MLCTDCGNENPAGARFCNSCGLRLDAPETAAPAAPEVQVSGGFVGRQREMGQLVAALSDALAGRGRLVMLVGEPGIGKTRTAQELAAIASGRGARVLWGRCLEGQGAPPYWPWIQPIRAYVQQADSETLLSHMGQGAAGIAEIIPEIKQKLPELKPPPQLDSPEQARFRLFDSITTFLKSLSREQPLALILDNLHWADRPSLLLLEFLAPELEEGSILILGTYRDVELSRGHPLAQTLGELTRDQAFQRVLLRGLTQDDVKRYVEVTARITPESSLVSAIYAQSEGNPLFVTELVRLLEYDLPAGGSTGSPRTEILGGRIPEGIREVIGRHLDRLSEECNRALTVASVMGREFGFDALAKLVEGLSEDSLLEALEEALRIGIIEEVTDGVGRYQFSHALIGRTLAEELSTTRRVRLHARIAGTLEALYADKAESHAVELAYHFGEAQTVLGTERLVRYSIMAGEQALAMYAYENALANFQRALDAKEVKPVDAETAAILTGLGNSQAALTQWNNAVPSFERAFGYYVDVGDVARAVAIAENPHSVNITPLIADIITRALSLEPPDSIESGRLRSNLGFSIGITTDDYGQAKDAMDEALSISRHEGDIALEMLTLSNMANVAGFHLRHHEALEYSLEAIRLAPRAQSPIPELRARNWAAHSLLGIGEPEKAEAHARALLELAERVRDRWWLSLALAVNARAAYYRGDWSLAREYTERIFALDPDHYAALNVRTLLEYQVGAFSDGDAYLDLMKVSERSTIIALLPAVIAVVAKITGDRGRLVMLNTIESKLPPGIWHDAPITTTHWQLGKALVAIELGDTDAARQIYATYRALRGALHYQSLGCCVERILGFIAHHIGQREAAAAHFEDALTFCRKADYLPDLAWTCYDYANLLHEQGQRERALALLEEALDISTELGMKPLMEKVVALRESAGATRRAVPTYPDRLTQREVEVLRLVAAGKTNQEIADDLFISLRTVANHVTSILTKTGAANRTEAASYANRRGLI